MSAVTFRRWAARTGVGGCGRCACARGATAYQVGSALGLAAIAALRTPAPRPRNTISPAPVPTAAAPRLYATASVLSGSARGGVSDRPPLVG